MYRPSKRRKLVQADIYDFANPSRASFHPVVFGAAPNEPQVEFPDAENAQPAVASDDVPETEAPAEEIAAARQSLEEALLANFLRAQSPVGLSSVDISDLFEQLADSNTYEEPPLPEASGKQRWADRWRKLTEFQLPSGKGTVADWLLRLFASADSSSTTNKAIEAELRGLSLACNLPKEFPKTARSFWEVRCRCSFGCRFF